jgi:hypothetical protein
MPLSLEELDRKIPDTPYEAQLRAHNPPAHLREKNGRYERMQAREYGQNRNPTANPATPGPSGTPQGEYPDLVFGPLSQNARPAGARQTPPAQTTPPAQNPAPTPTAQDPSWWERFSRYLNGRANVDPLQPIPRDPNRLNRGLFDPAMVNPPMFNPSIAEGYARATRGAEEPPIGAPPKRTTTGRVQQKTTPTQPVEPQASNMYYYDPGNGAPTISMGRHLPQGMKIGQQQGGGYISVVPIPAPTTTAQKIFQADFSGNKQAQQPPNPPLQGKPANVPLPPSRPAGWETTAQTPPEETQPLPSATPFTGNEGRASGGAIHQADKVAKEKATPCHSGIINMAVGGRTDHIPMHVLEGSYVLPADIVSGLGEGNTLAGSKILDNMFRSGPYGQKIPEARANPKFPAAPPVQSPGTTTTSMPRAAGGRSMNSKPVPIVAAGGEYVVHPDVVTQLGKGDMNSGHEYLDNFVKYVRAQTAKTLQNLPGPRKD